MKEPTIAAQIKASVYICAVDEYEIKSLIESILFLCDKNDIREINIIYSRKSSSEYIHFLNSICSDHQDIPVRALQQPVDGLGEAVFYAFQIAKGTHIIGTVADMQLDPHDIKTMIDLARQNPDAIIKSSRNLSSNGYNKNYPVVKIILNRLFNASAKLLMGSKQTDLSLPYLCMPLRLFHSYHFFNNHSAFMLETSFLPEMIGAEVIEFPITLSPRQSGKSHSGFMFYYHYFICFLKLLLKKGFHLS